MISNIPFLKTNTDLIFIEIKISQMDQSFAAIIDTGMEVSAIDRNVNFLDITTYLKSAKLFGADEKILSKTAQVTFHPYTTAGFSRMITENFMPCDIVDNYDSKDINLLPVVMIIGGDILKHYKTHIDYESRMIQIE